MGARRQVITMVCPPVRGDNPRAKSRGLSPRTGGQTMVQQSYTNLISVDLAQNEIFHAKICDFWQGGILSGKQVCNFRACPFSIRVYFSK